MPFFNALVLLISANIAINHILSKTRFRGLYFYRRSVMGLDLIIGLIHLAPNLCRIR